MSLDLGALAAARWFAGKDRPVEALRLGDAVVVPGSGGGLVAIVEIVQGGAATPYALPARLADGRLVEAGPSDPLWPALADAAAAGVTLEGLTGTFTTVRGALDRTPHAPARALSDDQSNTSIVLAERLVVKCYRRLEQGLHPEPELLAGLTAVGSRRAPRFGGALVRHDDDGEQAIACLYEFVAGAPVGWEPLIERLRGALADPDDARLEALAAETRGIGRAAGELHADLAAAFGVTTATEDDGRMAARTGLSRLEAALAVAPAETRALLEPARAGAATTLGDLGRLTGHQLIRCHGDLHVAQLIASREGPVVVDFEGEPGLPLERRRMHTSPLRDVACLLLSLDHVAAAAGRRLGFGQALPRALAWSAAAREAVLDGYASAASRAGLRVDRDLLLAWELEKELHEVLYAATVVPAWSYAPRIALAGLLERAGSG